MEEKTKDEKFTCEDNSFAEEIKRFAFISFCHDIGKFEQRANWDKGGGSHEKFSDAFIRSFFVDQHREQKKSKDDVLDDPIIKCADWLSALEREKFESEIKVNVPDIPFLSPFSRICDQNKDKYYDIRELDFSKWKELFPKEKNKAKAGQQAYKELWDKFYQDVQKIDPIRNFDTFVSIAEKYTSFIPSAAWKSVPDISLFDHMKLTSAIAVCFYIDMKSGKLSGENILEIMKALVEHVRKEEREKNIKGEDAISEKLEKILKRYKDLDSIKPYPNNSPIFSFIYLDICGIQNFIYKIAEPGDPQRGVAKQLRSRSFYLNILLDVLTRWLCEVLCLPYVNIIFCAGGNAYMFIPLSLKKRAKKCLDHFNEKLFERFKGDLWIASAFGDVTLKDWLDFPSLIEKMQILVGREKLRKAYNIIQKWISQAYIPCKACGMLEAARGDLCDYCDDFVKFGKAIAQHREFVCVTCDKNYTPSVGKSSADQLDGKKLDFIVKDVWLVPVMRSKNQVVPISCSGKYDIITFDTSNLLQIAPSGHISSGNAVVTFKPLVVIIPKKKNEVMSFECIVKESSGIKYNGHILPDGDRKLGILKADVDNLGKILQCGFTNPYPSRVVTFSRMLDIFFGVIIPKICDELFPNKVYSVYAGGDDLFLIARWDVSCDIAYEIRDKFRKWTSENPFMTLSGAIYICRPQTPVRFFAYKVEELLSEAKRTKNGANGEIKCDDSEKRKKEEKKENKGCNEEIEPKNRIYFVKKLTWKDYLWCISEGKRLSLEINYGKISRSLVHRTIEIYLQELEGNKSAMWYPLLYYQIQRNVKDKNLKADLEKYLHASTMKKFFVISNYATLKTRERR